MDNTLQKKQTISFIQMPPSDEEEEWEHDVSEEDDISTNSIKIRKDECNNLGQIP